jgi:hypothetical protein
MSCSHLLGQMPVISQARAIPSHQLSFTEALVVLHPASVVFFISFVRTVLSRVAGTLTGTACKLSVILSFCWRGLDLPEYPGHNLPNPEGRSSCYVSCLQLKGLMRALLSVFLLPKSSYHHYVSLPYPTAESTGRFVTN